MKEHNIIYLFVYTTDASSKLQFFTSTIRGFVSEDTEKQAVIELITSNPNIVDYFLVKSEVID